MSFYLFLMKELAKHSCNTLKSSFLLLLQKHIAYLLFLQAENILYNPFINDRVIAFQTLKKNKKNINADELSTFSLLNVVLR